MLEENSAFDSWNVFVSDTKLGSVGSIKHEDPTLTTELRPPQLLDNYFK